MTNKIKENVDNIFKSFEDNERTRDVKEEMVVNLTERINDLIEEGSSEEEAFEISFGNLGSTSEIKKIFNFKSIKEYNFEYTLNPLYALIATVIYLGVGFVWDLWHPGWVLFLVAAAFSDFSINNKRSYVMPVTILLYSGLGLAFELWHPGWLLFPLGFMIISTIDKKVGAIVLMSIALYLTVGYMFEEWGISLLIFFIPSLLISGKSDLIAGLWLGTIGGYLLIGFIFDLWHPGWVIFGIALSVTVMITEKNLIGTIWITSITSFILLGTYFDMWHPSWVVFVVAASLTAYLDKDSDNNMIEIKKPI